ncbi:F0F1 ATP synthase subunit alpha [Planctomycetota bacterium]
MKANINEMASILKAQIGQVRGQLEMARVGRVVGLADGIAHIYGLQEAMVGEVLEFEGGVLGEVFNLEEDAIGAVIYGDYLQIKEGSDVKATGRLMSVTVGDELLGRVVNPLCQPIDGGPVVSAAHQRLIETDAPGIAERQPVKKPLQTGLKCVDAMVPIGCGQRELIIGDRKTGKTTVALDTIINQKGKGVICVYVAIGQRAGTIAEVIETLKQHGAMEYTVVVGASASDTAPMQFVAPYAGCAVAEYFMYEKGRDTLCVYDDLSKHANAYRQLSLLLRRPPGREAYPGDIFYLHSRLLERSAKLSDKLGGGSLTALPIVETLEGQVSAYIPTNVISITDGQIYLQRDLFHAGVRPAIDVGTSVSRVGGHAQVPAIKRVAAKLRLDLAAFRELQNFARLGTELDPASQAQLDKGARMVELLKQPAFSPLSVADQVISLYLGNAGLLDDTRVTEVSAVAKDFVAWLKECHADILQTINETQDFNEDQAQQVSERFEEYQAK